MSPSLTIQLLTWNSANVLPECLAALNSVPPAEISLQVIDNASTDNSVGLVRQELPYATILTLPKNTGYAGGHNAGLRQCHTPFVLVLNPDVVIQWTGITALLAFLKEHPKVGAVQGKLWRGDGTSAVIDSTGIVLTSTLNGIDRGAGSPDEGARNEPAVVTATTGACSLYRLAALQTVAGKNGAFFDEDFFAYKEDVDLGWRLSRAGWVSYYVPIVVGEHTRALRVISRHGWGFNATDIWQRLQSERTRYSFRNWIWLLAKNATPWQLFLHALPITGRLLLFAGATLFSSQLRQAWAEAGRGLPAMVKKRAV